MKVISLVSSKECNRSVLFVAYKDEILVKNHELGHALSSQAWPAM